MTAVLDEKQRTAMMAQIPLGRPGTDLEIAQSVAFLASDAAAYITGHVLDVNGGMFMGVTIVRNKSCTEVPAELPISLVWRPSFSGRRL